MLTIVKHYRNPTNGCSYYVTTNGSLSHRLQPCVVFTTLELYCLCKMSNSITNALVELAFLGHKNWPPLLYYKSPYTLSLCNLKPGQRLVSNYHRRQYCTHELYHRSHSEHAFYPCVGQLWRAMRSSLFTFEKSYVEESQI